MPFVARRRGFSAGFARLAWLLLVLSLSAGGVASAGERDDPRADGERAQTGPSYPHARVRKVELGRGATAYWLFEPADPTPERAPVVVLNHGWLAVNPGAYGAWIDHLVRSGNVVIYPRYQTDALTPPPTFLPNALTAVRDALDVLDTAVGRVRPDRDRFAIVGHSAGGNLAAQMAAVAAQERIPRPRAVVALMPGEVQPSKEPDLAEIPPQTLLVVAVADLDRVVGDLRAREIFRATHAIPRSHKKFVFFRSDLRGTPRLVAHHFLPTALDLGYDSGDGLLRGVQWNLADINAFDRAGVWKLTDLTLQAAFAGRTLDDITERGERFRHLGFWSDGRAVRPPIVADDLASMPRVVPTNGVRLIPLNPDGWGFGTGNALPASTTPASPARVAEGDPAVSKTRR